MKNGVTELLLTLRRSQETHSSIPYHLRVCTWGPIHYNDLMTRSNNLKECHTAFKAPFKSNIKKIISLLIEHSPLGSSQGTYWSPFSDTFWHRIVYSLSLEACPPLSLGKVLMSGTPPREQHSAWQALRSHNSSALWRLYKIKYFSALLTLYIYILT